MPELPDVEVFKRYLDRTALHRRVDKVHVRTDKVLHGVSASTVRRHLTGHELAWSRRHGKLLFVGLGDDSAAALVLHFGMTGFLRYYADPDDAPAHPRLELELDDDHVLAFDCQRMFGEVDVADDVDGYLESRDVGPDVYDMDADAFVERMSGRRGSIKSALMNQSAVAGLGNVYSDEVLFQAHLHPETPVRALSDERLRKLHRTVCHVVERTVEAKADPSAVPRTWLLPHRREGDHCPRCGHALERIAVHQRHAWLCPGHQERPSA